MAADFVEDYLVTAEQASAALNLPLYYFIDARKRAELGNNWPIFVRLFHAKSIQYIQNSNTTDP